MTKSPRAYAVIIHNNKILLTKDVGEVGWKFPGGHVEENETFEQALIREIKEEVSLEVKIEKWFLEEKYCKADRPDFEVHKMYFLCQALNNQIKIDPKEVEDYKWFSFEEFNNLALTDVYNLHLNAFIRVKKIIKVI